MQADKITCVDCDLTFKPVKRHLSIQHGFTPEQYRERQDLP